MAKCKCGSGTRIVSNVCQYMEKSGECCKDVCTNPIIGDPSLLGIMAPLIYDEIGINLCTTFNLGVDVPTTYPSATKATVSVLDVAYDYGNPGVQIEPIAGRPNCSVITLSNLNVRFVVRLYDCCCRLLATLYPTAVYLPADTTAPTYDEDTNPSSVELELFTPYGYSYDVSGATPAPVISNEGFNAASNTVNQGVNLFGNAKLLDFSTEDSTVTVGLTVVLQSIYFVGYKVRSAGKIDIPKGSIISPDNSDCRKFVAGDLLNLVIKPLNLGCPWKEEELKNDCDTDSCEISSMEDHSGPVI